jgi:hypothetical protein
MVPGSDSLRPFRAGFTFLALLLKSCLHPGGFAAKSLLGLQAEGLTRE